MSGDASRQYCWTVVVTVVLQVGVHIADVTHFVPRGSLTDEEARLRATTVYLADRRYDMLPPVLSAQLCSLLGGVERYAVSCVWEIHHQSYKVRRCWYGKTVIRSVGEGKGN